MKYIYITVAVVVVYTLANLVVSARNTLKVLGRASTADAVERMMR